MEKAADREELLELYKLHAELADRVSGRREGANRQFIASLTGLLIFIAALFRFGTGEIPANAVFIIGGILGIAISASWFVVIRSYRQLNSGKFAALGELESKLSYPFFRREWEILGKGKNKNRYCKLTVVETILPGIFAVLFAIIFVYGVWNMLGEETLIVK